ncbi:hypothetical protein NPIL_668371, partial [Nephila pilipes]
MTLLATVSQGAAVSDLQNGFNHLDPSEFKSHSRFKEVSSDVIHSPRSHIGSRACPILVTSN